MVREKAQLGCAAPDPSQTGWHPAGVAKDRTQGVFPYLFQWFWVSEPSPFLCPLLPAPLTPQCCFMVWCPECFLLTSRSCLGQVIIYLLGALNPMRSLKAEWEVWAGAVLFALPNSLRVGGWVLWGLGDTSIWHRWLRMLPDFLKSCLEPKLNIVELYHVCSAELAAQGKYFWGFFWLVWVCFFCFLFFSVTRNNSLFSCWRQ